MNKLLIITLTLVLSLLTTRAGHIFSQPSEIIPQNYKYATDIHLFFSLETSLVAGDYIYVKFPFSVGVASATISVNLEVSGVSTMKLTRNSGTDPEHFFLLPSQLLAGTWYRFLLKVADSSMGSQTPGPQGCVNFQTASSDGTDRIIYDANSCLDYVSFGPAVDTTIFKVYGSYTYTQAIVTKNFGQTYTAFFDVFPNVEVEQGAIIQLNIVNPSFSFGSSCTSIDCLIGSTNPDCPSTYNYNMTQMTGTCTSNGQTLTFTLNQKVSLNPFRIQALIVNPNTVDVSGIVAIYKSKKAETWFATTSVQASSLNPISLATSYPLISATATVSLFWGLQHAVVGATSFLGCPIYIYKTPASHKLSIINSMQSSISITTTINSFKDLGYLAILWYPVEVTTGLTVLLSSIQSTFPVVSGTRSVLSYLSSQNAVNLTNIDTLTQGSNYKISGKFVIVSESTTASCGKVEFYKGVDSSAKLGTSSAATILMKTNHEKFEIAPDAVYSPSGATLLASMSYNIFHSYLKSSIDLSLTRSTADVSGPTLSEQFYKKIFENFYTGTTGKPGVFIRPSSATESDNYGLFILLNIVKDADICLPSIIGAATNCFLTAAAASYDNTAVVMLKIVFNNNVLNINSNDFPSGVLIVGTFFAHMNSVAIDYTTVAGHTGTAIFDYGIQNSYKVNFITQTDNYHHVTLICKPFKVPDTVAYTGCYNVPAVAFAGTPGAVPTWTSATFGGISFLKTKINVYPSQYFDTNVFDFLICYKAIKASSYTQATTTELSFTLTEGALVAGLADIAGSVYGAPYNSYTTGPSMYNAYVIQGVVSSYKSYASFVNYYADLSTPAYGTGSYFASYLRVHAIFGTSDISSTVSQVAIFVDGIPAIGSVASKEKTYESLKKYASTEGDINLVNHATSTGSQVTGSIFKGYDDGAATATRYHNDLWFSKSGFKYATTLSTSNAEVNVYIPVVTVIHKLESLHIAVYGATNIQTNITPLIGVFRVFGSAYKGFKKIGPIIIDNKNIGTINPGFPEDITATTVFDKFWSADTTPTTGNGCIKGTETSISLIKSTSSSTSEILPSKTYTSTIAFQGGVVIPAGTSCNVDLGNDLVSSLTDSTIFNPTLATDNIKFGSVFVVYSRDAYNIFTLGSTLSWSISNGATNKCVYHNIPFYTSSSVATTYYTILCQADKPSSGTASYGTISTLLTLGSFTVPFYWGNGYAINTKLQYVWSGYKGAGVFVGKDVAPTTNWILKTCVISTNTGIPKDTRDVSYTLTLSNNVNYILEPNGVTGDSLLVRENFGTAILSSSVSTALCEFPNNALVSCSLVSTDYTLKNLDTKKTTISSIIINVIIDTVGTTTNTHWAKVFYKDVEIEYCSETTPLPFTVDASQGLSIISFGSTSDFKYTNMKGARGAFYFTFSFSRNIRKDNVFIFNLGFFTNPTALTKNFRCLIINSNGIVSNNFRSISTSDLSASVVLVKTTMISGGSFRYKCVGGQTTDYSSSVTVPISATYGRSGLSSTSPIASTDTKITPGLIPPDAVTINQVSLTKLYKTKGFDSDYIISFIPSSTNITYSGRIIVEFTKAIPPKLNYAGVLSCYLNDVPAYCEFTEERRVSVWPNTILYKTNPTTYTLRISGVTQPNSIDVDSNPLLYLALDTNDNVFDSIAEQIFITDVFDTSLNLPVIIYVHDFAYSQNKIRSTTSITSIVNLPANAVSNNNFIYVQLPASLDSSLFYSPSLTCSIKRVNDPTLSDFAKACNLLRGRKVIIHLNTDLLNNVNLNYTVTLSNILTPQQPSSISTWFREDIKIFMAPDNQTVTYTSAPGNRNTTTYLNWIVDSNVILLNWLNTQNAGFASFQNFLDINTGHYATNPAIAVASANFNNTFTWQFSGSNTSSFTSQQNPLISNALQIRTGFSTSRFFIGAKENVSPGKYYLSTIKNGDTYNAYSPLPFLDIRVIQNTCLITPSFSSISIPAGGYSNPIVLNFQNCIPMTDITVMANLTTGSNLYLTFANGQTTHSQGMKFESILGNYQIYFYLYSANPNNNLTSGAATIAFTLSGTDAPFYSIAGGVSVNIIAPTTDAPVSQTPTIISSPGNAIVAFSCTQTGNIYYAIGIKSSVNSVKVDKIKNVTENSLIRQTVPDKDDTDYKILGYISYSQANVYQQVSISNLLKAGENYTVIAYCMNQLFVVGNSSATNTWIQPDNQGKTVALNFIFKNGALSSAQKLDLACGLARFFAISPSRVKTDEGISCPSLRVLQASNATVSNATTYTAYNWFIVKDYFSSSDSLYQDVQAKMRDSTFSSQVLKLTSNGVTGFPVVNATSNQIIDAYTIQGAILPTVVASVETSNWNSIGLSLSLSNIQGYIFAGIANQSALLPTSQQIRLGVDGSGNPLVNRLYSQLGNNSNFLFNFTNLQNTTNYTLFWFGSNLDTSINAVVSAVGQRAVATTSVWQYGGLLAYSFILMMTMVVMLINLA